MVKSHAPATPARRAIGPAPPRRSTRGGRRHPWWRMDGPYALPSLRRRDQREERVRPPASAPAGDVSHLRRVCIRSARILRGLEPCHGLPRKQPPRDRSACTRTECRDRLLPGPSRGPLPRFGPPAGPSRARSDVPPAGRRVRRGLRRWSPAEAKVADRAPPAPEVRARHGGDRFPPDRCPASTPPRYGHTRSPALHGRRRNPRAVHMEAVSSQSSDSAATGRAPSHVPRPGRRARQVPKDVDRRRWPP
ncbi:hypothetical protein HRbin39_01269 [bacterium HR39]|nr:hypothetical protein HRbin39_01269 [bacterium HR39]